MNGESRVGAAAARRLDAVRQALTAPAGRAATRAGDATGRLDRTWLAIAGAALLALAVAGAANAARATTRLRT
ncbi:MAG: hypothetical protein QOF26_4198 [Baekduia sp.]|nr:hypothetical protein [Baekduia sp.]